MFLVVLACLSVSNITQTRSTQRAQTSLAEADHYFHIAHCKNVEPWWWKTTPSPSPPPPPKKKKKKKKRIITCTTIWECHHYYGVFFAHLLILKYPEHHQNLISSSLYYPGRLHKISYQSVHNFLSNVVHRQTDRQTTNATKNITSFAKEVKIMNGLQGNFMDGSRVVKGRTDSILVVICQKAYKHHFYRTTFHYINV